jgi:hypothetical protein
MNTNIQSSQNPNSENITPRQIIYVVIGLVVLVVIFFIFKSRGNPKPVNPSLPSQIDQQIFNKSKTK